MVYDGRQTLEYSSEDAPMIRQGLIDTMARNTNPALTSEYQIILAELYDAPDVISRVVDGLAEDLGL